MDCIFCKIIKGEIPSYTLYENEKVKVILDVNPVSSGHCLVLPKEHTQDLDSISEDTVIEVFKAAKIVKEKLIEKLNIDGCTLVQNNGYGQEVKHYHLHMIPRVVDDQIGMTHDSHGVRPAEDVFKMMQ